MTGMAGPDKDMHRRQRGKNLVMLAVLLAFVVLVYVISIVRMGGG
jgi:Tfp pilus assembly protein PilW